MSRRPSFFLCALALAACDPAPLAPAVDGGTPDASLSRLLGPCLTDNQCPGNGAFCRTADHGYPGGQCTLACTDRTVCDDGAIYNTCATLRTETMATCIGFCRNATDCRHGYTCEVTSPQGAATAEGICIPMCATDAECGGTSQCDPYTSRCVPHGMVNTVGAVTGAACTGNADCRSGNCRLPMENGGITGFLGGYCESLCRIPAGFNTSNYFSGDTLPLGTCTGNAVCVPGGNALGENDLGVCLQACTSATDCRPGYTCTQTIQMHTFTNGYCVPMDCLHMNCPSGSTCHQATDANGNPYGICG
jgi:hypothetical protein